jgi:hypothetical protein
MTRSNPKFDPAGWFGALREWIVETTRESRMARLSTLGVRLPPYEEPNTDGWQDGMRDVEVARVAGVDAGQQDTPGRGARSF